MTARLALILCLAAFLPGCRGSADSGAVAPAAPPAPPKPPDLRPVALPDPRHGHRVHDTGGGLVVFGGFAARAADDDRGMRQAFAYQFTTDAWRRLPDMHVGKAFFASAFVDGAVWAVGTVIERFDVTREQWEIVCRDERLPSSHLAAAAVGRTITIIGKDVTAFDVGTRTLAFVDPWPGKRNGDHFHVVAVLDGTLHVIGGLDGESFQPMSDHWAMAGGRWSRLPDAPQKVFAKFAVIQVVGDTLYFFTSGLGLSYEPRRARWTVLAGMPSMLAMPASFARDGWIHVLGGMPVEGGETRLAYEIARNRWVSVPGVR